MQKGSKVAEPKAPCGPWMCENRSAPFPGRRLYEATKPSFSCLFCAVVLQAGSTTRQSV